MQLLKNVFLCLCMMISYGVFSVEADEVKSVSVMEGDSVTLHTDLTRIQTPDEILWMFEPQGTDIAEIYKQSNSSYIYDDDASFKGKLQLDDQTGSLTITNIRIKNSGLYKLTVRNNKKRFYKKFNVTVYDPNLLITPAVIVVTVFLLWLIAVVIYRHKKAQMDQLQLYLDLISRNMQEKCGSKPDRNTEEFPTCCRPTVLV